MIYRVYLKIGYCENWFDFDDLSEAGSFAETVLTHHVANEDNKKRMSVEIQVIDPTAKEEEV